MLKPDWLYLHVCIELMRGEERLRDKVGCFGIIYNEILLCSSNGVLELEPMNSYSRLLLHRLADIFG